MTADAPSEPAGRRSTASRRRASHSMESVLTEAVALLDESGPSALTFRALAARLGGGVASIYWYVDGKDELLDRAADHVLADVLAGTERYLGADDPIDALRGIGVTLYDAAADRPWLAAHFLRNTGQQPNSIRLYERIGQQVLRLRLSPRQSFHATSAVVGFVVGLAADMGAEPPAEVVDGSVTREEYMARVTAEWRALDADEYPFMHTVVDEFDGHRDVDQFRAGLDLLLAGLRQQAGAEGSPPRPTPPPETRRPGNDNAP